MVVGRWEGRVSHSFNHVQYVKTFPGWESKGALSLL